MWLSEEKKKMGRMSQSQGNPAGDGEEEEINLTTP